MAVRVFHRGIGPRILWKAFMGIFAVLGLGMLTGAALMFHSTTNFVARTEAASGVVTDLEYRRGSDGPTYYPVIRFRGPTGQDVFFKGRVGSNPARYARGETVTVLYDPETPEKARIDSFFQLWFGPLVLGGLGAVFGGIGCGYWSWRLIMSRRDSWLEHHGQRITAEIVDIGLDHSRAMSGQSPWRIRAQWRHPLSNDVYVFNSRATWFDPTPFVTGKEIDVLIDRTDPSRYMLDLSVLPNGGR